MKTAALIFVLTMLGASMSGCTNPAPDPIPDSDIKNGTPALFLSRTLTTLEADASEILKVVARDGTGNPTPFSVSDNSSCATIKKVTGGVEVTGLTAPCEATFTIEVPATNETRDLVVKVQDPLTMDIGEGLILRYTNDFVKMYDVGWLRILKPTNVPEGFYPVGVTAADSDSWESLTAILLSDSKNNGLLSPPSDYRKTMENGASVWVPTCEENYVALGVLIAQGSQKPGADEVRCVREDYTTPSTVGAIQYAHYQDGADIVLRTITDPLTLPTGERRIPLPSHTHVACVDGDSMSACNGSTAIANQLLIPADIVEKVDNSELDLQLVGAMPLDDQIPRFHTGMRLPFSLVQYEDPKGHSHVIDNTPFYTVFRTESYKTIDGGIIDNRQGAEAITKEYSYTSGFEDTDTSSFSHTVGVSITAQAGGGEVTGGSFVSITASYEYSSAQETSYTYGEESTSSTGFTIPAGAFAQIVQIESKWFAKDATGKTTVVDVTGGAPIIKYLQYPLPNL